MAAQPVTRTTGRQRLTIWLEPHALANLSTIAYERRRLPADQAAFMLEGAIEDELADIASENDEETLTGIDGIVQGFVNPETGATRMATAADIPDEDELDAMNAAGEGFGVGGVSRG